MSGPWTSGWQPDRIALTGMLRQRRTNGDRNSRLSPCRFDPDTFFRTERDRREGYDGTVALPLQSKTACDGRKNECSLHHCEPVADADARSAAERNIGKAW